MRRPFILKALHTDWYTAIYSFWEQFSPWTHTTEENLFLVWVASVKLEYPDKIQTQERPEFFRNLQSYR